MKSPTSTTLFQVARQLLGSIRPLACALATMAVLSGSARATVTATVTPSTTTSTSTTPVVVQVSGLTPGETVVIKRFIDANANGSVDSGEFLAEKFVITDGQVSAIGGVRNPNVPGDDDTTANGQISLNLAPALGPELGRLAGQHLIVVSSPTSLFSPITLNLAVNQPAQAQSITGTVTDGTNPVPYAGVFLLDATGKGEFVVGMCADALGHFTLNAPVGTYQVAAIKNGFVTNFATAPTMALTAGATPTQNLQLMPATTTISGKIADATTGNGLGGVMLFIQNSNGLVTVLSSMGDGTYSAPVTSDHWTLEPSSTSLNHLGYLRPNQNTVSITADTTSGPTSGVNINLTRANALIHGTVTTSGGTPLSGIQINANDSNHLYDSDAITDANGAYLIAATSGTWNANISSENPGLTGYLIPNGQSVTLTSAQATLVNFTLLTANAHLQGRVTQNGTGVSNIRVSAYNQNSNQSISDLTASDGSFNLGVFGGDWNVQVESSSAATFNIISPSANYTVADNQTLSGITVPVLPVTLQISGYVKDASESPLNANLGANTTINGVTYHSYAQTDGSGHYVLLVTNGTWQINAFANTYTNPNPQQLALSGSNATCNFTLTRNPVIFNQPADQAITAGQSTFFQVSANSNTTINFQWQVSTDGGIVWNDLANNATYSNVTNSSLNITSNSSLNGYLYHCVLSNSAGPTTSASARLTVNAASLSAQETWRQTYFGNPANSGNGADLNDFDHDGIPNLVEYAFGLNPTQTSGDPLPKPQRIDNNVVVQFTQPVGVSNVAYGAEWSESLLSNDWHAVADTGSGTLHLFSMPIGTHKSLFLRLRVSTP